MSEDTTLATYLRGVVGRFDFNEASAIEIHRGLLRIYGQSQNMKEQFALQLEPFTRT
jgi:hypothetical protein